MGRSLVIGLLLLSVQAQANPAACYAINDSDTRRVCLAKAHNDPARCYSVQAADKRAECLAEVKK